MKRIALEHLGVENERGLWNAPTHQLQATSTRYSQLEAKVFFPWYHCKTLIFLFQLDWKRCSRECAIHVGVWANVP